MEFKTGQLLATKSNTLISKGILAATGGKVSHIACVADPNFAIEARGDLPHHYVKLTLIDDMIHDPKIEDIYLLDPIIKKELISDKEHEKWLYSKIGVKYDYFNTLVIQVLRIFGLKKVFQKTVNKADNKYMCAELGVHAQQKKWGIFPKWPKSSYNPQEIFESGYYKIKKIK